MKWMLLVSGLSVLTIAAWEAERRARASTLSDRELRHHRGGQFICYTDAQPVSCGQPLHPPGSCAANGKCKKVQGPHDPSPYFVCENKDDIFRSGGPAAGTYRPQCPMVEEGNFNCNGNSYVCHRYTKCDEFCEFVGGAWKCDDLFYWDDIVTDYVSAQTGCTSDE